MSVISAEENQLIEAAQFVKQLAKAVSTHEGASGELRQLMTGGLELLDDEDADPFEILLELANTIADAGFQHEKLPEALQILEAASEDREGESQNHSQEPQERPRERRQFPERTPTRDRLGMSQVDSGSEGDQSGGRRLPRFSNPLGRLGPISFRMKAILIVVAIFAFAAAVLAGMIFLGNGPTVPVGLESVYFDPASGRPIFPDGTFLTEEQESDLYQYQDDLVQQQEEQLAQDQEFEADPGQGFETDNVVVEQNDQGEWEVQSEAESFSTSQDSGEFCLLGYCFGGNNNNTRPIDPANAGIEAGQLVFLFIPIGLVVLSLTDAGQLLREIREKGGRTSWNVIGRYAAGSILMTIGLVFTLFPDVAFFIEDPVGRVYFSVGSAWACIAGGFLASGFDKSQLGAILAAAVLVSAFAGDKSQTLFGVVIGLTPDSPLYTIPGLFMKVFELGVGGIASLKYSIFFYTSLIFSMIMIFLDSTDLSIIDLLSLNYKSILEGIIDEKTRIATISFFATLFSLFVLTGIIGVGMVFAILAIGVAVASVFDLDRIDEGMKNGFILYATVVVGFGLLLS